jgi:hypothetical protein
MEYRQVHSKLFVERGIQSGLLEGQIFFFARENIESVPQRIESTMPVDFFY